MEASNSPGERPRVIATIGAILTLIGYFSLLVGYSSLYTIFLMGCIILVISLFYYCINIFEVGGKFRWIAILMVFLPFVPGFLFFNLFSWGFGEPVGIVIGQLLGYFIFVLITLYLVYYVKKSIKKYVLIIPEKHKTPPDYMYVVITMMLLFLFYSATLGMYNLLKPL